MKLAIVLATLLFVIAGVEAMNRAFWDRGARDGKRIDGSPRRSTTVLEGAVLLAILALIVAVDARMVRSATDANRRTTASVATTAKAPPDDPLLGGASYAGVRDLYCHGEPDWNPIALKYWDGPIPDGPPDASDVRLVLPPSHGLVAIGPDGGLLDPTKYRGGFPAGTTVTCPVDADWSWSVRIVDPCADAGVH